MDTGARRLQCLECIGDRAEDLALSAAVLDLTFGHVASWGSAAPPGEGGGREIRTLYGICVRTGEVSRVACGFRTDSARLALYDPRQKCRILSSRSPDSAPSGLDRTQAPLASGLRNPLIALGIKELGTKDRTQSKGAKSRV